MQSNLRVRVIGAGLAGCEATWQLVKRGISVVLHEMKPNRHSPAHEMDTFSELVCSNSLKADGITSASGLLKEEMHRLDSLIINTAYQTRVPAGTALAVDRHKFSKIITETLESHPLVEVVREEVTEIPNDLPVIIATGPLTSESLSQSIAKLIGEEHLFFYDAASPIVSFDSLNMDRVFRASRYNKGSDYLNCPMTKDEYYAFYNELINADTAPIHGFEEKHVFEGCMPVESMARRGEKTLCFGPLKPVGLQDPRVAEKHYAVVQLRQEDDEGQLYNMVGFQTRLKFGEQKRVFSMIPGLKNAEFYRYGVMHRNTYIHSPKKLNLGYGMINNPNVYFAGQITGVEGYVESASSGLVAGVSLANRLLGKQDTVIDDTTAIGSLASYVSKYNGGKFQPMNINFGIIRPLDIKIKQKKERYAAIADRALACIDEIKNFV